MSTPTTPTSQAKMPLPRKLGYIFIAVLTFAVVSLAILQPIIFSMVENVPGYAGVPADQRGWPEDDKRGAFLLLNEGHNSKYPGNLLMLLATTQAGVVGEGEGAHLGPQDIKSILIQSTALSESSDYKVYRFGVEENQQMAHKRQPGGKIMLIETANGRWEPGTYIVDIPAEGMFGGRVYYQFYVDDPAATPSPSK